VKENIYVKTYLLKQNWLHENFVWLYLTPIIIGLAPHEKIKQPRRTMGKGWLNLETLSCFQAWFFVISGQRCKS